MGRKQPQRNHRVLPSCPHPRDQPFPPILSNIQYSHFLSRRNKANASRIKWDFGDRENLRSSVWFIPVARSGFLAPIKALH
ncbi:hypothetical protein I7I50_04173 [Histoplasma capsulatum G186AR]|uniref:Uncharacterized protein n=1 Tax=Ajellomyces capsulatus TaxID=5037 RepID=A0A8H7YM93_AJECA|nr:hypothetical protein I7I52_05081 [Histoplasma capsulatum]QSS75133.1 hypothetical protein I7I50_04173 [Histoplasma capsulatum G186AR]